MLTILLIRHATCDHVGRFIAGRTPGIHLNAAGREEAHALGRWLGGLVSGGPSQKPHALYSGPLERATETADLLGRGLGLSVQVEPGLDELDFGAWTGRPLSELDRDPVWQAFNSARETTRIPGGELMTHAIDRASAALGRMARAHPGALVIAVSHGDIIRGLVLRTLGLPMNEVHRIEVAPASVSAIQMWDRRPGRVLVLNWSPAGPSS